MNKQLKRFVVFLIIASLFYMVACKNTDSKDKNASDKKPIETTVAEKAKENKPSEKDTVVKESIDKKDSSEDEFIPMTEEEVKEAAKNKEEIRYETVKSYPADRNPKKSIEYEKEIEGVKYIGVLEKAKLDYNQARREIEVYYRGILKPAD